MHSKVNDVMFWKVLDVYWLELRFANVSDVGSGKGRLERGVAPVWFRNGEISLS